MTKSRSLAAMLAESNAVSTPNNGGGATAANVQAFVATIDDGKYDTADAFTLACDRDFAPGTTETGKAKTPNRSIAIRFLLEQRDADGKSKFRSAEIAKYFGIRQQQVSSVRNRYVKSLA